MAALPRIVLTQIAPERKTLGVFIQPQLVIGKRPDCDIRIDGITGISGHHAVLEWREGGLWVTDLDSAHYVRILGDIIPPRKPVPIASGTQLQLGRVVISVEYDASAVP